MVNFNILLHGDAREAAEQVAAEDLDNGELRAAITNALKRIASLENAIVKSVTTSNPRAQELFTALLDFLNQWKNRGETTSLHEWHMRMKEVAERAEAVLNKST